MSKTKFYPSTRHSAQGGTRLVTKPEDEEPGWEESPADHGIETAPGVLPDPAIAQRKADLDAAASDEANRSHKKKTA